MMDGARNELEAAFASVPESDWQTPSAPGEWSAAHVAAHLEMVEEVIVKGMEKVLAQPPRKTPLLRRIHIPVRIVQWRWPRRKTPIPVDEGLLAEREVMLTRLREARARTRTLVGTLEGRDLRPYRWPHPFLGNLNLYDWFRLLALHERRHTKQIREIVRGFQR